MEIPELNNQERAIITNTLEIPLNIFAQADTEDETWSWGLSPRVVQISKDEQDISPLIKTTTASGHVLKKNSGHTLPLQDINESLEPDMFLQVVRCPDAPEFTLTRPRTPVTRMLSEAVKMLPLKPDESFITDPGTFFGPESRQGAKVGEPRAAVVRRDVEAPPSAAKPRTINTLKRNKTLVVRGDNEQKTKNKKLALLKQHDNAIKPNFAVRQPKAVPKISEPKKFKSVPFVIPELSSKEKKDILTLPAPKGSKLESLQKRLRYDASKYAKCNVKTGSSSSETSEEEEEEEEEEEDEDSSENEKKKAAAKHKATPPQAFPKRRSSVARGSWARGTSQISIKRALVQTIDDNIAESDRCIIAKMQARGEIPTPIVEATSRLSGERSEATSSRSRDFRVKSRDVTSRADISDDDVISDDDGDVSDVSVTAEDLEMFDSYRWVDGETPSYREVEGSDRSASVEIANMLGNVSKTPSTVRKRSEDSPINKIRSESETFSSALHSEHVTTLAEEEGEGSGKDTPESEVGSLAEFISVPPSADSTPSPGPVVSLRSSFDEEELKKHLTYEAPTYEDVLNITGKNVKFPKSIEKPEDDQDLLGSLSKPDVTLLSTWAPETKTTSKPFSIHHFCTLAVQPQLPRVLHNLTRAAHTQEIKITEEDVRSHTELSWFEEKIENYEASELETETEGNIKIEGGKVPQISDKKLFWTPAPPKMDLPPLFIKTHLFPKYESAIASAEQQALIDQQAFVDQSSTSEEISSDEETDEEDRRLRERVLTRRHGSAQGMKKKTQELEILGPDKIKARTFRLKRPGSAPVLTETEGPSKYKSDYYASYKEMHTYLENIGLVQNQLSEEKKATMTSQVSPDKYDKLVRPYLSTPLNSRGMLTLSPSFTKLLPISTLQKAKITKKELRDVKECLLEKRVLKRSTSTPFIHEQYEFRKRAGSFNDLSNTVPNWETFEATTTALKETNLPVFAHKLGTILSKDIVLLHQIFKKDKPDLYSDILNDIHRLSIDIEAGGDYLYYNQARRGALYVKLGMFKEARTDLDSAIEAMPQMVDAYWHRHLIFVSQGEQNSALNDLTNIIRHNQDQSRVYLARAEIYQKQGDVTGAILNYSQALKRDASNAETYYKRASLFEEKGDILLALEDYTIANRLCPSNTVAILKKGKYNFERGAYSVAVADFTAMLEQEPYNSIARTYRGRAQAKMGKYTNALEDLSSAIHLSPSDHLPFYHRAVLVRKENPKRALQDFSVSIMLNPTVENSNAYLHRGIVYAELQRYDEAVPDFETVVELKWNSVEAHINLGLVCMLHLKQYKRAIRCFAAAIDVEPTNHRAYICRGDAFRSIKQLNEALLDYTRAIHIRPDIARYYLYRGNLLLEMENLDLAAQHIKFASVLNKETEGPAALQKAVVQSFLHNYDDAILVLDRAAGLDPSPSQYILLGKTYLKAKRFGEAVENFEKALMYMSMRQNPKILKQEMPKSAAEVYFLIGKCHVESGNYPSALEALNGAIRINPAYSEAYFQRGLVRIWVKSQRPLLDFNRALAYNPNYFQAYLTRAAYFGMKGRHSKAMFNCNEALKIQPNSVRAYLYRGALKFEIKNYTLAVDDLSAAIKLDPLCSLAYYNRAVCYQQLKRNKEALLDYGIVLLLEKELNQNVLLNRGLLYYQSEDFDNALVDFKLAVKDSPDNALLYHTLGLCYHRNNQLDEALRSLSHAMTLKEHFIQAYISRGNVYMSLNSEEGYKKSKRDYCRALHYDPTSLTAHVNLGIALQSYGKMNEAWKQFTSAINIDPDCYLALEARSIVNLQMSHLFGAFCDINTAVKLHPTSTMLTNRGVIQQYMGDVSNAMQDYQQAIAADSEYSLAYFNAANLYFNMRLFEKALKYYDAAVKHCAQDEGAVLNRAIAKVLLKDYVGALEDFDTAILLNPFAAHSYFNRANLHLTLGKNDLAEEDYRKALSLQPNDSSSHSQLAVALGRQFKKAEALDNFKMAIKLTER